MGDHVAMPMVDKDRGDPRNILGVILDCNEQNMYSIAIKRVQVGKDQVKAQSERDFHSKNRGGKKTN